MKHVDDKNWMPQRRLLVGGLLLALLSGVLNTGCKPAESKRRTYREVIVSRPAVSQPETAPQSLPEGHPPIADAGMDASSLPSSMRAGAGVELTWTAPEGWTETPGTGMRRVSFSPDGTDILCTIVALGGTAGGMESNLRRWLGQVNLNLPADQFRNVLANLEQGRTASGLTLHWVDFNPLVAEDDQPSVKAAVLEKDGSTVFVKMTGSASSLDDQDGAFRELVRSIQ